MNDEFIKAIETQSGLLGQSVLSASQVGTVAQAVINTPFKDVVWSERIWQRQNALREVVARMTERLLLQGKNPTTMVSQIRKEFGVSASEAKRLAITEGARVATEAQRQAYIANGYDEYEFIAEPSACPNCAKLDGKIFKVKDMEPGENAAPMHPWCHCSTGAYVDDKAGGSTLDEYELWNSNTLEKDKEKAYNQGIEGMQRKKTIDQNKMSVASKEQINRLSRKFRRRGGEFIDDEDAIAYLDERGAEAITLDAYTILKRKSISISALIEELEHAEQYLRNENDGSALSVAINEVNAKRKSIEERERYKLPKIEVESVLRDIKYYEDEIRRLQNEDSKF